MTPSFICAQLGARNHYVFPRALHQAGCLHALITDFWSPHFPLPGALQPARMRGRQHADLRDATVCSFNAGMLRQRLRFRLQGVQGWDRIMAFNDWFQRQALHQLSSIFHLPSSLAAPTLFAYSYAARDLLAHARSLGWRTILCQIDIGPVEAGVVAAEALRWSEFGPAPAEAPASYWQNWREELSLSDHIMVNSAWSRSAMLQAGVAAEKLAVIPLPYAAVEAAGQPPKRYPNHFSATRPLRVLFLGQVNHGKGVPAMLAALDLMADIPMELWVVGSVALDIPSRYLKHPRLRWVGPVARRESRKFYQNADVFLFPTHSDGFGLTQLEAQAWRLPVVASRNCGEVVVHRQNGWLLDRVTPVSIADALRHCHAHPEELARWSAASGVRKEFSLSAVSDSLLALIRKPL